MNSFRDDESGNIGGHKLLLGEGGELVDSLLVGLGGVGVVPLNLLDSSLKDGPAIEFFALVPVGSILSLPLVEGRGGGLLVGEVSSGSNECHKGDCDESFVHQVGNIIINLNIFILFKVNVSDRDYHPSEKKIIFFIKEN